MKKARTWILLLALMLLAYFGWQWWKGREGGADALAAAEDPALIYNRAWVDSKPVKYTDYVNVFLILDFAPLGIFERASAYDIHAEIYEHNRDGSSVRVFFPQHERKAAFSYRVSECDELPPYDLCLDLSSNPWKGPKRYYSSRDPDDESLRAIYERLRLQLANLPKTSLPE